MSPMLKVDEVEVVGMMRRFDARLAALEVKCKVEIFRKASHHEQIFQPPSSHPSRDLCIFDRRQRRK